MAAEARAEGSVGVVREVEGRVGERVVVGSAATRGVEAADWEAQDTRADVAGAAKAAAARVVVAGWG